MTEYDGPQTDPPDVLYLMVRGSNIPSRTSVARAFCTQSGKGAKQSLVWQSCLAAVSCTPDKLHLLGIGALRGRFIRRYIIYIRYLRA